jgi:protoheme IX farnesyltransferase
MSTVGPVLLARAGGRSRLADYAALAKPRVNSLVVLTAVLGDLLAESSPEPARLFALAVGTGLVAGGAAALNQVWEREVDGRMRRTAGRPLPAGRLDVPAAVAFAMALTAAGLATLAFGTNVLAAGLAAFTLLFYVVVYTPLKQVTSLATVVGAIPGAIPPMIGWAAGAGRLDPAAGALFGILFCWQMPHFLSIAWLYREDYARGGMPMLPVVEPDGASTGRQAVLYAATLVPVSLALAAFGVSGRLFAFGAVVLGALFTAAAGGFAAKRTNARARLLFFASIAYLPTVMLLAYGDKLR